MENEKVIVWGCGYYGKKILWKLLQKNKEIVAYTDSNSAFYGKKIDDAANIIILPPDEAIKKEHNRILLAVSSHCAYQEICELLSKIKGGYDTSKVVNLFTSQEFIELFMDQRYYFIKDFAKYIEEIKEKGAVAECGVYRGESAKMINLFFASQRKLYLFDTFEGFTSEDLRIERGINAPDFMNGSFNNDEEFRYTSIDFVMQKMKYPENVIIKKGYFPETATGIEEEFVFVNLDMDLYQPMKNGLQYFWPRLSNHGCILLHDYFHPELPGVRQAVSDFENEMGIRLHKTSIGDGCSIAIIK